VKAYQFLAPARIELFDISERYEAQAVGLGTDFVTVVTAAINVLRENPDLGAGHRAGTRRFVLPRFPCSLVYLNEPEFLLFVAVAHHRREPEYWSTRISRR
jgi:toxin ParE1/3/4